MEGNFKALTASIVWEIKSGVNFIAAHVAEHWPQQLGKMLSNSTAVCVILEKIKIQTALQTIKTYGWRRRIHYSTIWCRPVWYKFKIILEVPVTSILRIEYFRRSRMDLHLTGQHSSSFQSWENQSLTSFP